MRRIRYQVAMSLDGFIAGPNGEYDWIPEDPDIDFTEFFEQFDALLMGHKTYETLLASGSIDSFAEKELFVVSKSLSPAAHPDIRLLCGDLQDDVQSLRQQAGKDIWLFGGGQLFTTLLELELVDTVELATIPVLLGGGISMAPPTFPTTKLQLIKHMVYPKSGIAMLEYAIESKS